MVCGSGGGRILAGPKGWDTVQTDGHERVVGQAIRRTRLPRNVDAKSGSLDGQTSLTQLTARPQERIGDREGDRTGDQCPDGDGGIEPQPELHSGAE